MLRRALALLLLLPFWGAQAAENAGAVRNDNIYAPAQAAKPAIDFDGKGFIVNGKRTFISSGAIHYPRVPRALWDDRLLRLVRANFNCVETCAFWNLHEPREGEWDFSGEKDIGAFFDLAKQRGLYGIARVGPYVCAEWDLGGYPVWMTFKSNVVVRTENANWLALNDLWYEKILPIVVERQIHKGGNIILVQLENEHPLGWGVVETPYFRHLGDKATQLGLQVPYFMSGLNHGSAPQPPDGDTSNRRSPWFSTEFWSGWLNLYGPVNKRKLRITESCQWMIMARGGGGQNFYMLHGGSNFDSWNDPSGAASYDYGAAIGQAGDLRPLYYRMKRANQLAQSFPEILANGSDVSSEFTDFVSGAQLMGARRSPAGTLVFISNPRVGDTVVRFKNGGELTARSRESFAVPVNVSLGNGHMIASSTVRLLGVARNGDTTTVIVHGRPGDSGILVLTSEVALKLTKAARNMALKSGDPRRIELRISTPQSTPEDCVLEGARGAIRVVSVSSDLSCYTWILGEPGRQFVVCGPAFVRDLTVEDARCSLVIERPYGVASCGHVAVFGAKNQVYHLAARADQFLDLQPAPVLQDWQMASFQEAEPEFDDSRWKPSVDPLPIGADGDASAFAWYRAAIQAPVQAAGTLTIPGTNNVMAFFNGELVANGCVTLRPGANTLAVFTSHTGRDKCFGKMDDLSGFDNKGITGKVTLEINGKVQEITGWRMRGGIRPQDSGRTWGPVNDTHGAPTLFKATFNARPPGPLGAYPIYRAAFGTLSRGTMWLNGHCLGRFPERIPIRSIYLPECWINQGANELVVLDETGANATAMKLVVENAASREVLKVSEPVDPATPILVAPENTATDLPGLNRNNLAFKAVATASTEKKENPASAALDGDIDTDWSASKPGEAAWLCVDLGKPQMLRTCEIEWGARSVFFKYTLEVSLDGQRWTKIGDETTAVPAPPDSPSELSRLQFNPTQARFVRVATPSYPPDKKVRWPTICELRLLAQ